jgi:hypothetical protein
MTVVWKQNLADFRACLARHQRREVYHWTPASALPSILEHGILCRRELEARNIVYVPHSYGTYGKDEEFAGHVCVSFQPQKGMMRAETGPVAVIEMRSILVAMEGTFYSPVNSARNDYDFSDLSTRTSAEDLDALFQSPTSWWLIDWQAEVWLPVSVPPDRIVAVNFRNMDDLAASASACQAVVEALPRSIDFKIGKSWVFPSPDTMIEGDQTDD